MGFNELRVDYFCLKNLCIFARNLRNMVEIPQTLKFQ